MSNPIDIELSEKGNDVSFQLPSVDNMPQPLPPVDNKDRTDSNESKASTGGKTLRRNLHNSSIKIEIQRNKKIVIAQQRINEELHHRDSSCFSRHADTGSFVFTPRRYFCSDYCRIRAKFFMSDTDSSVGAFIYGSGLIATILISYVMAILETFRDTDLPSAPYMAGNLHPKTYIQAQAGFVLIFAIDTFVRFCLTDSYFCHTKLTIAQKTMDPHNTLTHVPFFIDIWNWIDMFSIFIVFVFGFSASFFIVLSIFRPIRNISAFKIITKTMEKSLSLISISTFFLFSLIVFFSFLILGLESCYNNDCQFVDGFNALYFVVISMTTVGFGDQIPTDVAARTVTVIAIMIGSFYLAMPLGK